MDTYVTKMYFTMLEPSAPPRAVSVRMLDNTSVIVSWLEPPPEHHNGQLKGYKVAYFIVCVKYDFIYLS